jgi:N-acetylglucosamine kinase-like BadF-type ATPase
LLATRQHDGGWAIVGRGAAGPSNLHAVGANALRALDDAVSAAFAAAGRSRGPVAAACLGLAGAGRPDDQQAIHEWARQVHLGIRVVVTSDAEILLAAGTPDGWGLAVVAGTGSIAYGRTADGRTARAGGWGYLLGDEGSGYALVLAGLQAVARAADGRGPATALTEAFLTRLGLARPQELVATIYRGGWDRPALAALAPLVLDAARANDAVAGQLVRQAAEELAETAAVVARQLGLEQQPLPVGLAGGVLLASDAYRQRVLAGLAARGIRADPVQLVPEPAAGAVRLAMTSQNHPASRGR